MRTKAVLTLSILLLTALLVGGTGHSFAQATPPGTLDVARTIETAFWLNNGSSGADTTTLYPSGRAITAVGSTGSWFETVYDRLVIAFPPGQAYGSVWIGTYTTPTTVQGFVWFRDMPGVYGVWVGEFIQPPEGMIYIPAGEFQMGCDLGLPFENCNDDELPLHTVYLDAYNIDRSEVTNEQYAAFLNARSSNDCDGYECADLDDPDIHITFQGGQYVVDPGFSQHPVEEVTWYGSEAFCAENGKRLPTEAEWEKAARGSADTRMFTWGNSAPTCTRANYRGCQGDTTPVGNFLAGASPYGGLDMAGNVWEWVNDWNDEDYYYVSPYANPQGPPTGTQKVKRGGSWNDTYWYDTIRVAVRHAHAPMDTYNWIGFRCATDVLE